MYHSSRPRSAAPSSVIFVPVNQSWCFEFTEIQLHASQSSTRLQRRRQGRTGIKYLSSARINSGRNTISVDSKNNRLVRIPVREDFSRIDSLSVAYVLGSRDFGLNKFLVEAISGPKQRG